MPDPERPIEVILATAGQSSQEIAFVEVDGQPVAGDSGDRREWHDLFLRIQVKAYAGEGSIQVPLTAELVERLYEAVGRVRERVQHDPNFLSTFESTGHARVAVPVRDGEGAYGGEAIEGRPRLPPSASRRSHCLELCEEAGISVEVVDGRHLRISTDDRVEPVLVTKELLSGAFWLFMHHDGGPHHGSPPWHHGLESAQYRCPDEPPVIQLRGPDEGEEVERDGPVMELTRVQTLRLIQFFDLAWPVPEGEEPDEPPSQWDRIGGDE